MHTVGAVPGLYLRILPPPSASRSWILRINIAGARRDIGLGGYPQVSIAQARDEARVKRQMVCDGIDPILEKRAAESARRAATTKKMTFAEAADRYIAIQEPGWRNAKHAWQWRNSLDKYVIPKIGRVEVGDIGITQVLSVLEPMWQTTTETASRVRGRIELILAWADKRAERERLNPARWRGHLDTQLPRPSRVARPKHHKTLSLAEMPFFITCLRDQDSMAARALEFAILTAARSGEVRYATWAEVDLVSKLWTIPAERMKGGREHRVPLSDAAMALLRLIPQVKSEGVIFWSPRSGPLNDSALLAVCRKIGADCVPHGFRSTFRDWCAEHTNASREVAEMALAHAIGNEVEAAYRRGDLFEKRRGLMAEWAAFCERDDHRCGSVQMPVIDGSPGSTEA
ncbi:MAG: integrase arm-type DNA-binding domain-containing protein [Caldimonas sp.]